ERVDADPVHLGLRLIQPRHRIAKGAQLLGAHAAERRGKKGEHDRLPPLVAQLDRLAILVRQGEVRRLRSNVYSHVILPLGPCHAAPYIFLRASNSIFVCHHPTRSTMSFSLSTSRRVRAA